MKKHQNSANLIPAFHENYGHAKGMAEIISTYGRDYLIEQAQLLANFPLEQCNEPSASQSLTKFT